MLETVQAVEPGDITDIDTWKWGDDGKLYMLATRPLGANSVFVADMNGFSEHQKLTPELDEWLLKAAAERQRLKYLKTSFDEENTNLQEAGYVSAWATRGEKQGTIDLVVNETYFDPYVLTTVDASARDFILDPKGKYIFHNSVEGLRALHIGSGTTRRIQGTYGSPVQTQVLAISPSGDSLVFMASGSCTQDAATEQGPGLSGYKYVCLARIRDDTKPADPWVGKWSGYGDGKVSAAIRRGTEKPEYLVVNLAVGRTGCSGAVTLYGKPDNERTLSLESYDSKDPKAPVCKVSLELDNARQLLVSENPECNYYHGASCVFDGWLTEDD